MFIGHDGIARIELIFDTSAGEAAKSISRGQKLPAMVSR